MPTKTDRILGYLPGTFRALPRPNTLYSVVDAFGSELQQAENASAALMLAHWPDLADHGAELVGDLACIAALYGLAPRGATPVPVADETACPPLATDETVEEFREHLKRYVRTFLEGTTTVQGTLRIVAEALGLHIADAYADLDCWWTRGDDRLVTTEPRGDGATEAIFGTRSSTATGAAESSARIGGHTDLRHGADLRGAAHLHVALDGGGPVDVDLTAHRNDPPATFAQNVAKAIGDAVPALHASIDGGRLVLTSATTGAASRLEVLDADDDAAPSLLGLPPRRYRGSAATGARVTGTVPLDGGVDFSPPGAPRYLRVIVDGTHVFELDCARAPVHRTLGEITGAINAQAGFALASDDGHVLTLTSPSTGFASSIAFEAAAAQDALAALLGTPSLVTAGRDAQAARVTATRDGSAGVDLSGGSRIELAIDGAPAVTIDCAGSVPSRTQLNEIVDAINAALGKQLAEQDGHFVTLRSAATGPAGTIAFLVPASGDATAIIFGLLPRTFAGAPAVAARLVGKRDIAPVIDVGGTRRLAIALDGGPARIVDLRASVPFDAARNRRPATPQQICDAIDAVFGSAIATTDGHVVTLTSPTTGASSRIALLADDRTRTRRFATRAFVTDDAASRLFGVPRAIASGTTASAASLTGSKDLSRGVDLSLARALRVALDGGPFTDVDCAAKSARPRAALAGEIVEAIGAALGPVASSDGRFLSLTSPSAGASSRIAFETGGSALGVLFGGAVSARGRDATPVVFRGTADLSGGVDLSAGDHLKLALDGGAAVEFGCAGPDPAHTSLSQICARINIALHAGVASTDGKHVVLTSVLSGAAGGLEIDVPGTADATAAILGVTAPRAYRGTGAQPARIAGLPLHEPLDLRATRFLAIRLDGGAAHDVDCAGPTPSATTLDQLVSAINAVVPNLASRDASRLIVTSATAGASARIELGASTRGDARAALFNSVADVTNGKPPSAATISGGVDLRVPVNLAEHGTLLLAVDGAAPFTVDVAGTFPDRTALDEIVARLNAAMPGLASVTADDRLQLTSPASGESSRLELRPLRALEVIEYPPVWREDMHDLRYGQRFTVKNDGACASAVTFEFRAQHGVEGAELVNLRAGLRLRLATALGLGEAIRVRAGDSAGLRVERQRSDGTIVAVSSEHVVAAPLGGHAFVPFAGERRLRAVHGEQTLTLDDAQADFTVQLRALDDRRDITVRVTPSAAAGFDVEIGYVPASGSPVTETYRAVTIGSGADRAAPDALAVQINQSSSLVRAGELDKGAVLRLPLGTSTWTYLDCDDARFDSARFDEATFAGGTCREYGIFDVSLFSGTTPPPALQALFAGGGVPSSDHALSVRLRWQRFAPGAFTVGLPADLPDEYGARFDRGRFATGGGAPETYDGVVFDPRNDPDSFTNRITSALVNVKFVDRVPIGFEGYVMPFHQPRERFLSLGAADAPAALYLTEPGVTGFYELTAKSNGTWGNAIAVTARKAGPARFDVTIGFNGARFENGRITALAGRIVAPHEDPLPALAAQILKAQPVGVLQAKAAGVYAAVTRDRAQLTRHADDQGGP